jgi:hypothetical protein
MLENDCTVMVIFWDSACIFHHLFSMPWKMTTFVVTVKPEALVLSHSRCYIQ